MRRTFLVLVASSLAVACSTAAPATPAPSGPTSAPTMPPSARPMPQRTERATESTAIRYVALGDSYTIGTGVMPGERWPNQLVRTLRPGLHLELVENLGVHGSTSADLIAEQLPRLRGLEVGFASVLIGANDVVHDVAGTEYRENVRMILDALVARLPAERLVVVSTPDHTVTPGWESADDERQRGRIHRFNEIVADEAKDRDVAYIDITAVAERAEHDGSLIGSDGVHPSAKQYQAWVEVIAPVVRDLLEGH